MRKSRPLEPNKPLTTTTAYFPPLAWLLAALRRGVWQWEAHETYQKGGWRNRCRIAAANGPLLLTIPLEKGKHQQQPVREVAISYHDDWPRRHQQAIRSAYGRAPYFEHYGPALLALLDTPPPGLWDLNLGLLRHVIELLQVPVSLSVTGEFRGAAAGAVPSRVPEYPQVFADRHGFLPGLSLLDGLFCLGPELAVLAHQR